MNNKIIIVCALLDLKEKEMDNKQTKAQTTH